MNRKNTARLAVALAVSMAVSSAAGCSAFGGEDGDGIELTLLTLDGGEDNQILEEAIDAFEAENEGITVTTTYVPEDTYPTKLQTALLADAPDLAAPYGTDTFFSFEPLNDLVFSDEVPIDGFNGTLQNFCGWGGTVYCVGTTVGNMVLFYNRDIFDAAGVAYPETTTPLTFDEISTIAAQLTQPGASDEETVFGFGADVIFSYLDPAYVTDATGRTIDVLNPGFLGAVDTLAGMVADGDMPSGAQIEALGGGDGSTSLFLEGKLAMFVADNFVIDSAEQAGLNYGLAPTPVVAGGAPWVVTWTNGLGIPLGGEHTEEAARFVTFLITEGQELQAQYGFMPLSIAVAETWATTEQRQQLVEIAQLVRPGVFNPNQWAWNSPLIDAYNAALRGESAEPLFEEAQPKAQQGNDTTWEAFDRALAASQ